MYHEHFFILSIAFPVSRSKKSICYGQLSKVNNTLTLNLLTSQGIYLPGHHQLINVESYLVGIWGYYRIHWGPGREVEIIEHLNSINGVE